MTKHTPGPWKLEEGKVAFKSNIYAENGKLVVDSNAGEFYHPFDCCEEGEANANALLIAAAPDLLVALEDLLEMAEDQARFIEAEVLEGVRGSLFNQDDVLDAKEKLDRAKAVIAKAENHSNEK